MNCQTCGRPAENGQATHWLGCEETRLKIAEPRADLTVQAELVDNPCEFSGCGKQKKPWSGKGAKPKYCADGHKKEK
jgi:hypothetical protein